MGQELNGTSFISYLEVTKRLQTLDSGVEIATVDINVNLNGLS
jgi:hypothetical protein